MPLLYSEISVDLALYWHLPSADLTPARSTIPRCHLSVTTLCSAISDHFWASIFERVIVQLSLIHI